MENIFDTKISYYNNVTDKVGSEISLRDFLFCDKYKEQIETLRTTSDMDVRKSLKKQLPLATISGIFAPTRRTENLISHSRLICIDIDKQDNMNVEWFNDLDKEWHHIPQILYALIVWEGKDGSPSFASHTPRNIETSSRLCVVTLPGKD